VAVAVSLQRCSDIRRVLTTARRRPARLGNPASPGSASETTRTRICATPGLLAPSTTDLPDPLVHLAAGADHHPGCASTAPTAGQTRDRGVRWHAEVAGWGWRAATAGAGSTAEKRRGPAFAAPGGTCSPAHTASQQHHRRRIRPEAAGSPAGGRGRDQGHGPADVIGAVRQGELVRTLVIGAGIARLTLAGRLCQQGRPPVIVEQAASSEASTGNTEIVRPKPAGCSRAASCSARARGLPSPWSKGAPSWPWPTRPEPRQPAHPAGRPPLPCLTPGSRPSAVICRTLLAGSTRSEPMRRHFHPCGRVQRGLARVAANAFRTQGRPTRRAFRPASAADGRGSRHRSRPG
jgi:hypothetical protein